MCVTEHSIVRLEQRVDRLEQNLVDIRVSLGRQAEREASLLSKIEDLSSSLKSIELKLIGIQESERQWKKAGQTVGKIYWIFIASIFTFFAKTMIDVFGSGFTETIRAVVQ